MSLELTERHQTAKILTTLGSVRLSTQTDHKVIVPGIKRIASQLIRGKSEREPHELCHRVGEIPTE